MNRPTLHLGDRLERRLVWVMQVGLVGMFFIGLDRRNTGIIVNSLIGLAVAQLPPLMERDYDIPMDPTLTLWITVAVFFHALGTVGIPGADLSFYRSVWWWDHLTHALSASVVAAAGYATVRAIDLHTDKIHLPSKFMFVFLLLFVLAFGVLWEVLEFVVSEAARVVGGEPILTQYGLEDTMLDLVFNAVGAIVVALWGTAYLSGVVGALAEQFDDRSG
ncbi:hypothetical protein [Halocatena salina]|uniref:DUF2238 domain-containing protein n=1 Tax=Halocatena salina TaxID=2934340 RepID=A0A8U0A132_9EURY|nr:hypothetical protein [Halocatena salina]UPM42772.1 hypothetical protein MW046_12535 [Halocatena salina]